MYTFHACVCSRQLHFCRLLKFSNFPHDNHPLQMHATNAPCVNLNLDNKICGNNVVRVFAIQCIIRCRIRLHCHWEGAVTFNALTKDFKNYHLILFWASIFSSVWSLFKCFVWKLFMVLGIELKWHRAQRENISVWQPCYQIDRSPFSLN